MFRLNPALRGNPELQSAVVRLALWLFSVSYIGLGALTGYYEVELDYYFGLFGVYLVVFIAMLVSVLRRPVWELRRYVGLALDITAVSLAIFLTREAISPFYLLYIWIFISYGTRYGCNYLITASIVSVLAYNLVLVALDEWQRHTFEAVFFLLLLAILPLYQYTLLRKLEEARREAETANKAKGDFLAVMTHELRTPLTGVIGMTHLLQSTPLTPEQREYTNAIVGSAEVLRALIGDVLDLSKIDACKLHLEAVPFDLRATAQEVCGALEHQALEKGLELILAVDPGLPESVRGDQLRVRQILFNLVGNAIKFTDCGEVRLRISARPAEAEVLRPHVLLVVEDTGIGIPRDRQDEIFESFCQADDSTTRRYGGTGLGTTIARDLTRLMGGRIGLSSEPGRGSRFWVRLPLLGEEVSTEPAPADGSLAGLRALVYERNQTQRDLILEVCRGEGMTCEPVDDLGRLSRVSGSGARVDLLIIADSPQRQDLPAMRTLLQRLLGAEPPHLFLTYAARRGENEPGGPCLNKPFLPEALAQRVRELLGPVAPVRADTAEDPLAPPPAAEQVGGPHPDGNPGGATPRVLVAEDNDIAARVITALLEREGLEVVRARNGQEALEAATRGGFRLALIDLRMPLLDGLAFTRAFRDAEPPGVRLPIVALTADAAQDVRDRCLAAGMDEFLSKPIAPAQLLTVVRRWLTDDHAPAA